METTKRLVMTFRTASGSEISLTIDDPRSDVTEGEIKAAMELVVGKNVFAPKDVDIVEAVDAKIVVTDTTDYDLIIA